MFGFRRYPSAFSSLTGGELNRNPLEDPDRERRKRGLVQCPQKRLADHKQ
jgi:hypothetical protein